MAFKPIMTVDEILALLDREFPQIHEGGQSYYIDAISPGAASLRLHASDRHLRPGGTVSGPSMMALSDFAAYVVILAHIGPVALAVTTSLNINFVNKPDPGDIVADCTLLKLGKRLAVTECRLHSVAADTLVAHATATYSIPPR